MTFLELILKIEIYLHIKGRESREVIKDFINEAILEFGRAYNWKWLVKTEDLTLDDSDSYTISTIASEYFIREISLVAPYSSELQFTSNNTVTATKINEYTKYNYKNYIQLSDKSYTWSIEGDTLYVTGVSGELKLSYITAGANYPLTNDNDTDLILTYYNDIIKKMAVIKYLDYLGDTEVVSRENNLLGTMLVNLRSSEKRGEHSGKFHQIGRK